MLVIFIVAFIVTLTAAVYMQFSSQAEKYVLLHKLDPDAFLLGAVCMGALSVFALANSGFSNGVGLAILFFSWIPCALIAVRIEKLQENLCKQRALPAGHNAQLAASFGMSEFDKAGTCEKCLKKGHVRNYFDRQHGWILSLCVDSVKCDANVIYCVVDFADDFVLYTGTWEDCNQVMQENYGGLQVIPHANITKQMWLQLHDDKINCGWDYSEEYYAIRHFKFPNGDIKRMGLTSPSSEWKEIN